MADIRETCVEYIEQEITATFYSGERKLINKILKLAEERPDEVKIICMPEYNDGHILAHIPKSWLKISPPAKRTLSEEQRAAAAERMRNMSKKKGV